MNRFRIAVTSAMLTAATFFIGAQSPWLHLYYPNGLDYQGWDMTEVLDITFDEESGKMIVNVLNDKGESTPIEHEMTSMSQFRIGPNVPALRVVTNEYYTEIPSKEYYFDGTFSLEGRGAQEDFSYPVQIRGRGNSTWGYSKKPYRLKFDSKQRVLLPKKAKSFVLLANYIDPSMMRNFAAFKFGQIIEMPHMHHAYPVDVYFNDIYKGSYTLTGQVGFNNGSVDLTDEEEANSIMFELDSYDSTDEDEYPFDSEYFDSQFGYYLPVRVKDPDAPVDEIEREAWLNKWRNDFNNFMSIIDNGNVDEIFAACDIESLVRYIMVANIACNQEVDHPKSVFLYKTDGGKYIFGPCWDFDWAYGYAPTYEKGQNSYWGWDETSYPSYENPLLGHGRSEGDGGAFFYALCNNEQFLTRFREVWDDFYLNRQAAFWQAFDEYVEMLRPSANLQGLSRSSYMKFDSNVETLRSWIQNRFDYINTDPNMGLWEDGSFSEQY